MVILYSIYYLSARESLHHFYIYLLLFMGAMLGVVFSDNLMVLYVFWELTSISSFLLIAFWYHRKGSRYGAQKSLLITVSGGVAMLAGFIMIYIMTDTLSIREIISSISHHTNHPLFLRRCFWCCSVLLQNQRNFLSIYGSLTQWKPQHLLVPICILRRWSKLAFIWLRA